MSDKPQLFCVWNVDRQPPPMDELFAPGTLTGDAYQNALLRADGKIPDGPLPEEAMRLFMDQVRALPNMQDLYGEV
jgi:hypothetical protein